jgi:hypothetical protein
MVRDHPRGAGYHKGRRSEGLKGQGGDDAHCSVMLIGDVVAAFLGIDAEQKSLEDIAQPLSAARTSPTAQR